MRQFIVLAHELSADAEINLDDLPGAGRLDLLSRCVTSALLCSHDIRENVRVHLVVDGYLVSFDGETIRGLSPDERSTAARIRRALPRRLDPTRWPRLAACGPRGERGHAPRRGGPNR